MATQAVLQHDNASYRTMPMVDTALDLICRVGVAGLGGFLLDSSIQDSDAAHLMQWSMLSTGAYAAGKIDLYSPQRTVANGFELVISFYTGRLVRRILG